MQALSSEDHPQDTRPLAGLISQENRESGYRIESKRSISVVGKKQSQRLGLEE